MATGAVMFLVLGQATGKISKDRSWLKVKIMMAKVDQFQESLINYEKENIPNNVFAAIRPYLKDKEFDPDFLRSKYVARSVWATCLELGILKIGCRRHNE